MLNRLIQIQLLLQKSTDADKAAGRKKWRICRSAALLERAGSQEAFDRQFKAVGMTADGLRTKVDAGSHGAIGALTRELGITVTDAEVKQFLRRSSGGF